MTNISLTLDKEENGEAQEPASKRRKVDGHHESRKIIKLTISPDQRHLIAVNDTDKCVRVYEVLPDGSLVERSQRYVSVFREDLGSSI